MAKRNTKQIILEGALHHLALLGFNGVTAYHIADYVGVRPSALYKHYTGLQNIFETVTDVIAQQLLDMAKKEFSKGNQKHHLIAAYTSVSKNLIVVVAQGLFHRQHYRNSMISKVVDPLRQAWLDVGGDLEHHDEVFGQMIGAVALDIQS
jgi:AcrR family transcriptional regulator